VVVKVLIELDSSMVEQATHDRRIALTRRQKWQPPASEEVLVGVGAPTQFRFDKGFVIQGNRIEDPALGASCQKQGDDIAMIQDRGVPEGGATAPVDCVELGTAIDEEFHDASSTSVGGHHQCRLSQIIGRFYIGTPIEQQIDDFVVTELGSDHQQWAMIHELTSVRVGSFVELTASKVDVVQKSRLAKSESSSCVEKKLEGPGVGLRGSINCVPRP
jgi:hypothetical protein